MEHNIGRFNENILSYTSLKSSICTETALLLNSCTPRTTLVYCASHEWEVIDATLP